MLKFIHAADFHLDSALASLSEERSRQRRQERLLRLRSEKPL